MPDEIINEEQPEVVEEKPPRAEIRNKDLSDKLKTTAEERDAIAAEKATLEKENQFYKGFSKVASKYTQAGDYQDKILEKYQQGYDLEDATISVLAKAGKLDAPQAQRQSPAGGSATTAISGEERPVGEMTTAEKRQKLREWEQTNPGELANALRSINLS